MTRRQLLTWLLIVITVTVISALTGFAQSGRWALLATGVVAGVLASFAAPEYFGWREPPDA
jgi:hypothetical protein